MDPPLMTPTRARSLSKLATRPRSTETTSTTGASSISVTPGNGRTLARDASTSVEVGWIELLQGDSPASAWFS